MHCNVKFFWDSDAKVWVATCKEIPSLILESGSFDALIERVKYTLPEMHEIIDKEVDYCDLEFISQRLDRVRIIG